jgi:hypothetical protein
MERLPCKTHTELDKEGESGNAFETKDEAMKEAKVRGCDGVYSIKVKDKTYWIPCESRYYTNDIEELKAPCTEGYEMIGMKDKDGRKVPNCVPIKR